MNVLIVGSGGREHALTWKAAQSPRLTRLYVAPGNAGTAQLAQNVPVENPVAFAREKEIDLVIIGPEAPLDEGLADELRAAGVRVFGPSRAAAQIEASKAFAKAFMTRHSIPTARYAAFTEFEAALEFSRRADFPIVVKASGLAAGKGVIVPPSPEKAEQALRRIMVDREFGAAGEKVVIEEQLQGEEVSLLAFTDGIIVKPMPPARDHKRLRDDDQGPNTGGMGTYAPAQNCSAPMVAELTRTILQPAIGGLREEGKPFVGTLYAGLMLTANGPRVLEFNCRFGDPETQVLMPLLDSDLLDVVEACVEGCLAQVDVRWKEGAAACVVLASEGYPDRPVTGHAISGLTGSPENVAIFHAGTRVENDCIVTAGGRVLGVTGWGRSLDQAVETAYAAVNAIQFQGMQYRSDIGHAAMGNGQTKKSLTYTSSGVNIAAGNRAVESMRETVRSTYGPHVLAGIGAFAGMFSAATLKAMRDPVLVASTDGVGTKVKLAAQAHRYRPIGLDIVNHCVNDILVHGARPLFFLDYLASSRLDPDAMVEIVTGIAAACRDAGCALLGGETAEMPGVYQPGAFDVAGTMVGVVEREDILPRPGVSDEMSLREGDVLIGLRSSGPHTNGYSLIRKVFEDVPLDTIFPELGVPLADALLVPHRSYLLVLQNALAPIKALVHITGGGFFDNLPRVLPERLGAVIRREGWPVPPLFRLIQDRGGVPTQEMYHVFNMGIGMIAIASRASVETLQRLIAEPIYVIGELVSGEKKVVLV